MSGSKSFLKSEKQKKLERILLDETEGKKVVLAFSAGVDSTILLYIMRSLNIDVTAVTFDMGIADSSALCEKSKHLAEDCGADYVLEKIDAMAIEAVRENRKDRCYFCKKAMFSRLRSIAEDIGASVVLDGTNADDLKEYRPGLRARDELRIKSPVAMAGITKAELREIGKFMGLKAAGEPSSPCLLTRFPYNTHITPEMTDRVYRGEKILHEVGFKDCRLRCHGSLARIEIPKDRFSDLNNSKDYIYEKIHNLGFDYVTLDLNGLRSGSMDIGE